MDQNYILNHINWIKNAKKILRVTDGQVNGRSNDMNTILVVQLEDLDDNPPEFEFQEKTVAIEERKLGTFYEGRITDKDTDYKDFTITIQTEPEYDGFFEIKKVEPDQYTIRLA